MNAIPDPTRAGLSVIVEEGPWRSSSDFRQLESQDCPTLHQESASRRTADKAIAILQERCVGGSTTVNRTSSLRTPAGMLQHWREHLGLPGMTDEAMAPWFQQAEQRLAIRPWLALPNENNQLLRTGAARLGIPAAAILHNVRACHNLGLTVTGFGAEQAAAPKQLAHTHALLALLRDGFHPQSVGGQVGLRSDGSPELDCRLNDFVTEGARRARLGMAGQPMQGVVRPDGTHWHVAGLSVHDGSLFPTSVSANPQLSVYGLAARLAAGLAKSLTGRDVRLA